MCQASCWVLGYEDEKTEAPKMLWYGVEEGDNLADTCIKLNKGDKKEINRVLEALRRVPTFDHLYLPTHEFLICLSQPVPSPDWGNGATDWQ